MHNRRRPRAVAILHVSIRARILMQPQLPACLFVETQDSFNFGLAPVVVICDKHTPHGNGWPRPAIENPRMPFYGQTRFWNRIDHASFPPDSVPLRPPPLWPVVAADRLPVAGRLQQLRPDDH